MSSVIIRLQNLPMSANASNIRRFFTGLSIPEGGVHIVGGEKGDAFIAFSTDEDARRAMLQDHQQINSVAIRLFLSSKAEMQSVIETARSSVMMAAQHPTATPSLPRQQDTVQLVPNQPLHANTCLDNDNSYYQPNQTKPVQISAPPKLNHPPSQQIPASGRPKEHPYQYDQYPNPSWDHSHGEINNQMAPEAPHHNKPYHAEPGDDYYYPGLNDRGPPPREAAVDGVVPSRRAPPGKHYASDQSYPPPEYGYGDGPPPYRRGDTQGYPNAERDFSVRPPWLKDEDSSTRPAQHRRYPQESFENPPPFKRSRGDDNLPLDLEACYAIKVSLCPVDVSVKNLFEILRGVNIVPKFGIRVEEDSLRRYTGNIYCLLSTQEAYQLANAANGSTFRGKPVQISDATIAEFFSVTDTNFQSKCPPQYASRIPTKASVKPNFHVDGCIEMTEVPPDVSKQDIVSFLGAPGLTVNDVKISPIPGQVRVFVKLPSARDLDILMSAPPRPYGPNQTRNVLLIPVSRMQFLFASSIPTSQLTPQRQTPSPSTQALPAAKMEPRTCAFLYGLAAPMASFDIAKLFPSVATPSDSIHLLSNGTAAVIDFVNETNCKKALLDFANAEASLKSIHRSICMRSISRKDFEQKCATGSATTSAPTVIRDEPASSQSPGGYGAPKRPINPPSNRFSGPPNHRNGHQFRTPPQPPAQQVNVHVTNLHPKCSPDAIFDVFRPFRPLPGSLRFRRDPAGNSMGEAMISFGSYPEAERVQREVNGYRLFGRNLAVRIQ